MAPPGADNTSAGSSGGSRISSSSSSSTSSAESANSIMPAGGFAGCSTNPSSMEAEEEEVVAAAAAAPTTERSRERTVEPNEPKARTTTTKKKKGGARRRLVYRCGHPLPSPFQYRRILHHAVSDEEETVSLLRWDHSTSTAATTSTGAGDSDTTRKDGGRGRAYDARPLHVPLVGGGGGRAGSWKLARRGLSRNPTREAEDAAAYIAAVGGFANDGVRPFSSSPFSSSTCSAASAATLRLRAGKPARKSAGLSVLWLWDWDPPWVYDIYDVGPEVVVQRLESLIGERGGGAAARRGVDADDGLLLGGGMGRSVASAADDAAGGSDERARHLRDEGDDANERCGMPRVEEDDVTDYDDYDTDEDEEEENELLFYELKQQQSCCSQNDQAEFADFASREAADALLEASSAASAAAKRMDDGEALPDDKTGTTEALTLTEDKTGMTTAGNNDDGNKDMSAQTKGATTTTAKTKTPARQQRDGHGHRHRHRRFVPPVATIAIPNNKIRHRTHRHNAADRRELTQIFNWDNNYSGVGAATGREGSKGVSREGAAIANGIANGVAGGNRGDDNLNASGSLSRISDDVSLISALSILAGAVDRWSREEEESSNTTGDDAKAKVKAGPGDSSWAKAGPGRSRAVQAAPSRTGADTVENDVDKVVGEPSTTTAGEMSAAVEQQRGGSDSSGGSDEVEAAAPARAGDSTTRTAAAATAAAASTTQSARRTPPPPNKTRPSMPSRSKPRSCRISARKKVAWTERGGATSSSTVPSSSERSSSELAVGNKAAAKEEEEEEKTDVSAEHPPTCTAAAITTVIKEGRSSTTTAAQSAKDEDSENVIIGGPGDAVSSEGAEVVVVSDDDDRDDSLPTTVDEEVDNGKVEDEYGLPGDGSVHDDGHNDDTRPTFVATEEHPTLDLTLIQPHEGLATVQESTSESTRSASPEAGKAVNANSTTYPAAVDGARAVGPAEEEEGRPSANHATTSVIVTPPSGKKGGIPPPPTKNKNMMSPVITSTRKSPSVVSMVPGDVSALKGCGESVWTIETECSTHPSDDGSSPLPSPVASTRGRVRATVAGGNAKSRHRVIDAKWQQQASRSPSLASRPSSDLGQEGTFP